MRTGPRGAKVRWILYGHTKSNLDIHSGSSRRPGEEKARGGLYSPGVASIGVSQLLAGFSRLVDKLLAKV